MYSPCTDNTSYRLAATCLAVLCNEAIFHSFFTCITKTVVTLRKRRDKINSEGAQMILYQVRLKRFYKIFVQS